MSSVKDYTKCFKTLPPYLTSPPPFSLIDRGAVAATASRDVGGGHRGSFPRGGKDESSEERREEGGGGEI